MRRDKLMRRQRWVTAAMAIGLALPAAAQTADAGASGAPSSAAGIAVLSGGVGETAKEEMKRAAKDFNVRLVFSNRQGEHLADVPYTVTDARGRNVASGTTEGPLLYLRLPPGSYTVAVQTGGKSVAKRVKTTAPGSAAETSFVLEER